MKPLNLDEATQENLLRLLKEYKIDAEIDEDEDIRIDGSPSIFLKQTPDKEYLKFFGSLPLTQEDTTAEDGDNFAFVINVLYKITNFTYMESELGKGIFFEAVLLKRGYIDEGYLIEFYQELRKIVSKVQSLIPSIHEIKELKKRN